MRIKGWLDSLVLAVAADSPAHGYSIASTLRTAGVGELADASLYPVLKKLEADGLVTSDWETGGSGPARKVYAITQSGTERLAADIEEWGAVQSGVNQVFAAPNLSEVKR